MKSLLVLMLALFVAASVRADTLYLVNGREMEGKILQQDENSVRLEVESGVVVIPMSRIKRIEKDTPEQAAEREHRKAAAAEFAAKMKAEGKILYKGEWTPEAEVRAQEKVALAKKKAREAEEAAAKKAQEEEVARQKALAQPIFPYNNNYTNHGGARATNRRDRYYDYGADGPNRAIYGDGFFLQDGTIRSYRRW